jgi:hypothetical protein
VAKPPAHLSRARSNLDLATRLRREREYNWAVTITYYAALHEVCALLSGLGIDTETLSHIETEAKLDRHFPGITSRYLSLQGMSRRARYLATHVADDDTCRRASQLYDYINDFGVRVRGGSIAAIAPPASTS